jgi:hypothetical protein
MPDENIPAAPNSGAVAPTLEQIRTELELFAQKMRAEFGAKFQDYASKFENALQNVEALPATVDGDQHSWLFKLGTALFHKFANDAQVNHVGAPPPTDADKAAQAAYEQTPQGQAELALAKAAASK